MTKKKTEKKTTTEKVPAPKTKASGASADEKKSADAKKQPPVPPASKAAAMPRNDAPVTPAVPMTLDPRLPALGTMLQKRDRHGAVRCECTVEDGGIRYAGKVYRSLSAAAMAAAKDLGLTNKTQNGFTFWGLSKPPRRPSDPLVALGACSS